jgi:hypothetical protein
MAVSNLPHGRLGRHAPGLALAASRLLPWRPMLLTMRAVAYLMRSLVF